MVSSVFSLGVRNAANQSILSESTDGQADCSLSNSAFLPTIGVSKGVGEWWGRKSPYKLWMSSTSRVVVGLAWWLLDRNQPLAIFAAQNKCFLSVTVLGTSEAMRAADTRKNAGPNSYLTI